LQQLEKQGIDKVDNSLDDMSSSMREAKKASEQME
jgi:hypothetical protein